MLYSELLTLTNGKASYEQFLDVEKAYMKKESMTKKQAATLWKRRYGKKPLTPRPKELKEIKTAIHELISNREYALDMEANIEKRYDEEISSFDPESWYDRNIIKSLKKKKENEIWNLYEGFGNDISIHIIYVDGSECCTNGLEIVAGEVTPKMQHIAYASYMDGYTEYDTLSGCLDDLWDLSEDEGITERDDYFSKVEILFNTEWGKRNKSNYKVS